MKTILLIKGEKVRVDDDDYAMLRHFKWKRDLLSGHVTQYGTGTSGKFVYMHHLLMEPYEPFWVVHRDNDPLNCQKVNLALCLPKEAMVFRRSRYTIKPKTLRPPAKAKSGYYGVYSTSGKRWYAQYKRQHLGVFTTKEAAAIAYNKVVKLMHPDGSHWLNDVPFTDDGTFPASYFS